MWPVGDSGCNPGDTLMDTRGHWVKVVEVLAIHIRIHMTSVVGVAVVLVIHIWMQVTGG